MDDYAGEDLLRRQAVVSVDGDGRVADAESFAEVVVFARDVLRELYDVLVVGHWDIDAILAATYEEVALHVGLPRVCGLWRVFSESRKTGRITQKPAPEACVLMKRNSGAEMTVLNLWHFFGWGVGHVPKYLIVFRAGMSRNATQQGAGFTPGSLYARKRRVCDRAHPCALPRWLCASAISPGKNSHARDKEKAGDSSGFVLRVVITLYWPPCLLGSG